MKEMQDEKIQQNVLTLSPRYKNKKKMIRRDDIRLELFASCGKAG